MLTPACRATVPATHIACLFLSLHAGTPKKKTAANLPPECGAVEEEVQLVGGELYLCDDFLSNPDGPCLESGSNKPFGVDSLEACFAACAAHPLCSSFSFRYGSCFLQDARGVIRKKADSRTDPVLHGYFSLNMTRPARGTDPAGESRRLLLESRRLVICPGVEPLRGLASHWQLSASLATL